MKRIIAICIIALMAGTAARAQKRAKDADRQKWITELRTLKRDFLTKELGLTAEQQSRFFPLYEEMDAELSQINTETRDLEQKVLADETASDTEMAAAALATFQQKKREGEVEARYFDKFSEVLTPRQLISLKNAERKFTQQLVQRHGHLKANGRRGN